MYGPVLSEPVAETLHVLQAVLTSIPLTTLGMSSTPDMPGVAQTCALHGNICRRQLA